MSTYEWAYWLKAALEADPVLKPKIIEVPGWTVRGRPPSQFSFFPSGVLEHHTACMCRVGHDPQSCVNTIVSGHGSTPGPISQLLGTFTKPGVRWNGGNLDPHIVIIAAGRSNHAGTGEYSWGAPGGNGGSIGVEWCGPVSDWPDEVIEFRARVSAALLRNRNWGIHQDDTHYSYARPLGRKIDPSGAYASQPNLGLLQPWDRDTYRSIVNQFLNPPPPPNPSPIGVTVTTQSEWQQVRVADVTFGPGDRIVRIPQAAGKKAATIALHVVTPNHAGFVTAFLGPKPDVSTVNYSPGVVSDGTTTVPVDGDGWFALNSTGYVRVLVDLIGVHS